MSRVFLKKPKSLGCFEPIFRPWCVYIGVGAVLAKLGSTAKPTMIVSVDDAGVWKIRTETTFKTHEIRFQIGQEFDETTPDGRKVRVRGAWANIPVYNGFVWPCTAAATHDVRASKTRTPQTLQNVVLKIFSSTKKCFKGCYRSMLIAMER